MARKGNLSHQGRTVSGSVPGVRCKAKKALRKVEGWSEQRDSGHETSWPSRSWRRGTEDSKCSVHRAWPLTMADCTKSTTFDPLCPMAGRTTARATMLLGGPSTANSAGSGRVSGESRTCGYGFRGRHWPPCLGRIDLSVCIPKLSREHRDEAWVRLSKLNGASTPEGKAAQARIPTRDITRENADGKKAQQKAYQASPRTDDGNLPGLQNPQGMECDARRTTAALVRNLHSMQAAQEQCYTVSLSVEAEWTCR